MINPINRHFLYLELSVQIFASYYDLRTFCLIQEIIELQFEKKLDTDKIDKLHSEFSKNPVCDRLLKQIILRYCYMHDIGFKHRQKLANIFNIPIQVQRSILIASKTTQD
ncbi:hypothetical protein [uncultured Nostoc sp.]|uniref:hypothetical protein n=1 Tax=uncultured Nostoc sp. TaxID=340711 RepID=UPI0035CA824B